MIEPAEEGATTLLFCRSHDDGTIAPQWNSEAEESLQGSFEVGMTIADRYLLREVLGSGAMGRVFLASDLRLERPVAMKVVCHSHCDADELEALLAREARLGATLSHRCIAAVFDFGFVGNKSYTIFEYIEGETLRALLERSPRLEWQEVVHILRELAAALDFAHLKGIVHRDFKPENVGVSRSGEFKILDLGIARDISRDIETCCYSGTPAYSSPEQAACMLTDGRSDQYALALVAYEMLTGRKPFEETNVFQMLERHIHDTPPSPGDFVPNLPASADNALLRALAKDPQERFTSCTQFVTELAREIVVDGRRGQAGRHILQTPQAQRIAFYVAHTVDDSLLARQLATQLAEERYATWYCGHDAVPGIPLVTQSREAIQRSQAVIVLISRLALRSGELAREIEQAYQTGVPILPILNGMSSEEFEKSAPAWCRMWGDAVPIEYRQATTSLNGLCERLVAAADSLGIEAHLEEAPAKSSTTSRCVGQTWATDAVQIDIQDLNQVLYRNATIDQFLVSKHKHFVVATKGFGKTLLLTSKRHLIDQQYRSTGQSLITIPEGRPYLDFMSELRTLSVRFEQPLSSISTTTRLWSMALRVAIISHHPQVIVSEERIEVQRFPERLQRWLAGTKTQPTVVFKELTSLRVSELNRLIDGTENFLDQKLRQVHSATYLFLDKVDQAIRHLHRDAWIAIQAGLIEASWELMNANSHIRIYASIRQEAFANYRSETKSNLFSATTTLDYSEEELHGLLDQLARCYEGSRSFADFLGLNVVRHARRPAPEDSYHYVRRHTCGRPRDLVAIASELSSRRDSLNEMRLREIVQRTSSSILVANVFDEVRVLLNCLNDEAARARFLAMLPSNILEYAEMVQICEQFNGLEPGTLQHFGHSSDEIFHPFLDLFFAGLLGVIDSQGEHGEVVQRFRRPHDSLDRIASELPESPVYLIHPALDTFIRAQRGRQPFLQFQHIQVGEDLRWEPHYRLFMQIEKQLAKVSDPRFVDTAHQLLKRIQTLLNSGADPLARLDVERSADWRVLQESCQEAAEEEAKFWLTELLEIF